MATSEIPPTPPSPGVGIRRKGPKVLPRLPLSAFSPPNSGTGERFPLPPSPSTVHPEFVVDAHVVVGDADPNLATWKKEAGQALGGRIGGVVIALPTTNPDKFVAALVSPKLELHPMLTDPTQIADKGPRCTHYFPDGSVRDAERQK